VEWPAQTPLCIPMIQLVQAIPSLSTAQPLYLCDTICPNTSLPFCDEACLNSSLLAYDAACTEAFLTSYDAVCSDLSQARD
jgi:hypothetical protein